MLTEKEQELADKILDQSVRNTIKNVQWYLVLMRAVKLRMEIEKPQTIKP